METFCLIASEPASLRWRYWQGCFLLRTMRGEICLGHLPQFLVLWQSGVHWLVEASFLLCFHLYMVLCVCVCVCVCVCARVCVCLGLNLSFSYKDTCPLGLGPTEWPHSDFLGKRQAQKPWLEISGWGEEGKLQGEQFALADFCWSWPKLQKRLTVSEGWNFDHYTGLIHFLVLIWEQHFVTKCNQRT